jgi:hypothetical protein
MRNRELDAALAASNPVGRERVAAIGLVADRAALLDAVAAEALPPGSASPRRGYRSALPVLVLLVGVLVAATVLTAPGKAVTGWVGERLGFGEPGGPPSLRQLNESWSGGSSLEGRPQHVLVVGPVTGEERSRYEFITYDPRSRPDRPTWPDGPCFKLDLTQRRSMTTQGCGTLPKGGEFTYLGVGGGHGTAYRTGDGIRFRDELQQVSGRVGPAVATVEATVNGREIPVQVRPVPANLRARFGLGGPFSFFVGFFTGVPRGGTVEVFARGTNGEVLGHARSELFDQVESAEIRCRMILESEERIPTPALEECRLVLGRGNG